MVVCCFCPLGLLITQDSYTYKLYTISIVSSTYCRTGNMSSSCLAKSAKANYLKIERKNKKQTKHSLVIQLYLANSRMNNTMIISCEIAQVLMGKSC